MWGFTILMLALVAFALTAQTAFATNESSYKRGYQAAFDDYYYASTESDDADWPNSNDDVAICQLYVHNYFTGKDQLKDPNLTNSTACEDGYLAGWKHWCKTDGLNCAYWASTGTYPSLLARAQKQWHCLPWCFSIWDKQGYYSHPTIWNKTR